MLEQNQKGRKSLNMYLNEYFSIFMVGVIILALAFSYVLFLGPKFQETMTAIQASIDQQQMMYDQQQRKLNDLKLVAELYQKINVNDLEKFNQALPDKYVQERLFGEIEEVVGASGFIVGAIKINDEEDLDAEEKLVAVSKKIGVIKIDVSLEAIDYRGLKNLLHIFENNLRLIDIIQVNFSPSENSAQIVMVTYYYKSN